jgi:DNA-binding NtrC family response regulator
MGGNVQLQSWPGEGTTVRLYLPLAARSEAFRATDHGARMPREQSSPTQRKESVLVVDDDQRVRRDLIRMLEELGYDPMVAADGAEGVLLYQKHQRRIRAVLLDMVMPGMGGEQVFKMLRKIDPRACVLVISGHTTIRDMQGLLSQGVRGCLPKPFDKDQLQQALTEALRRETRPLR